MKKRIAVGVLGTIAVLGLAYIPGSSLEPGFEGRDTELIRANKSMREFCGPDAEQALAWREKDGEIIGSCFGR